MSEAEEAHLNHMTEIAKLPTNAATIRKALAIYALLVEDCDSDATLTVTSKRDVQQVKIQVRHLTQER
jgi:hypothetical protein